MEGKDMISNSDVDKHRVSLPDSQILPSTSDPRSPSVIYNRPVFYGPHFNNVEYVNLSNSESGSLISSERSLSIEDDDEFWQVPLVGHYVSRHEHEEKILDWLNKYNPRTHTTPAGHMLRISGYGSAGKTTLAIFAAGEAINKATVLGFKKVVWLSREDRANMNDVSRKLRRMTASRSYLVILDDIEDEDEMRRLSFMRFVLVSTRRRDFGEHLSYKKTDVEVSGLTSPECKSLIEEIIGEDRMRKLCEAELLEDVLTLCEEASGFPLTVNIISSFLKKDIEIWQVDGKRYISNFRKQLNESQIRWNSRKLHSDTDYCYTSSYAAVDASIDSLSKDTKERYYRLIIFEKGQLIFPISTSIIWTLDTEEAKDCLEEFCRRYLINRIGYRRRTEQIVYNIHDVVYDTLRFKISELQQLSFFKTEAINKYASMPDGISTKDEAFYLYFIAWCLTSNETSLAFTTICSLDYLARRMVGFGGSGMITDFKALEENLLDQEYAVLNAYRTVTHKTLERVHPGAERETMLATALLRPHWEKVYTEAVRIVEEGRSTHRMFASYWKSPILHQNETILEIERSLYPDLQIKKNELMKSLLFSCIDLNDNGEIIIAACRTMNFFTHTESPAKRVDFQAFVLLAKFLRPKNSACIVVTGPQLQWWTIHFNVSAGGDVINFDKNGPHSIPVPEGETLDMQYDGGYLWILMKNELANGEDFKMLHCFLISENELRNVRAFQWIDDSSKVGFDASDYRLQVGCDGRIAAVTSSWERKLFFFNKDEPIKVSSKGAIVFCQQNLKENMNGKALILNEKKCLAVIEFSFDTDVSEVQSQRPEIYTYSGSHHMYAQAHVHENHCFYHNGFDSNVVLTAYEEESGNLVESRCLKLPIQERQRIYFVKDKIITFDNQSDKLLLVSIDLTKRLTSTSTVSPDTETVDEILHCNWSEALQDFVVIFCGSFDHIFANLILSQRNIDFDISDISLSPEEPLCVSINKTHIAMANDGQPFVFIFESTSGRLVRSFQFNEPVLELCFSSTHPDLLIVDIGCRLMKVMGTEKEPEVVVEVSEEWRDVFGFNLYVYNDRILMIPSLPSWVSGFSVFLWHNANKPSLAISSAIGCVVSCDFRYVVTMTESGQLFLWDLKSMLESRLLLSEKAVTFIKSQKGECYCCGVFCPSGTKLILGIFMENFHLLHFVFVIKINQNSSVHELNPRLFPPCRCNSFLFLAPNDDFVVVKDGAGQMSVIDYKHHTRYSLFEFNHRKAYDRIIFPSSGKFVFLSTDESPYEYYLLKLHLSSRDTFAAAHLSQP